MGKLTRADSGVSSQLPLASLSIHSAVKQSTSHKSTGRATSIKKLHKHNETDRDTTIKQHSGDKRTSPAVNKENNVPINKVLKTTKARKSLNNAFEISDSAAQTKTIDNIVDDVVKTADKLSSKLQSSVLPILLQCIETIYNTNTTIHTRLITSLRQFVPLTETKHSKIHTAIEQIISKRHMQRIETQLLAFSTNGTIQQNHLPLYCQYPHQYQLYCNKCKQYSMLVCMCTQCGVDAKHISVHNEYSFMQKLTKKQLKQNTEHDTESHPLNDPVEMLKQREEATLRAIACLKKLAKKTVGFDTYGGDILFLLRNAIFRGQGAVSTAARDAVEYMINKWDKSDCSILDTYCEHEHLMGYTECLHAKIELQWHDTKQLDRLKHKVRSALSHISVNDILRFDPSTATTIPQTDAGYCVECGTFQPLRQIHCNVHTTHKLTQEREFEAMTESLVWTSVFNECDILPFTTNDSTVHMTDVLKLIKHIRPYQSLATLGRDSYITQSYWITHLLFIMSGWGSVKLDKTLFLDELIYLLYNMDVVIQLNDPELVGEYLHSLHILGIDKQHQCMLKGYFYLLTHEITTTVKNERVLHGNWVKSKESYHKQYHTAYTGVIGLADMKFDKQEHADKFMPKTWYQYFE